MPLAKKITGLFASATAVLSVGACTGDSPDLDVAAQDVPYCWDSSELWEVPTGRQFTFEFDGEIYLTDLDRNICRMTGRTGVENKAFTWDAQGNRYAIIRGWTEEGEYDNTVPPEYGETYVNYLTDLFVVETDPNSPNQAIAQALGCRYEPAQPFNGYCPEDNHYSIADVEPLFSKDGSRILFVRAYYPGAGCAAAEAYWEIVSAPTAPGSCGQAQVLATFDQEGESMWREIQGMAWGPAAGDTNLAVVLSDGVYIVRQVSADSGLSTSATRPEPIRLFDPAVLGYEFPYFGEGLAWNGRFIAFSAGQFDMMGGYDWEGEAGDPRVYLYTSVEWHPDSCIQAGAQPQFGNPPCIQPTDGYGQGVKMHPQADGELYFVTNLGDPLVTAEGPIYGQSPTRHYRMNTGVGPQMDWTANWLPVLPERADHMTLRPRPLD